jgi:osmotically-inducible protein OsmY
MYTTLKFPALLALGLGALSLGGCTSVILGGVTAGAVAVAQERSVGAAIDDTGIEAEITAELFRADQDLFAGTEVRVVEGRVVLTGTVPKPEQRLEATRIAWNAHGVTQVDNEIQVEDESGIIDYAKDAWISTQLKSKILTDLKVMDLNYSLETVNGVVYVVGIARSQEELDRVIGYARNIGGVVKVVSHVRVNDQRGAKA